MVFFGLTILIATISFLYFRHLPRTWHAIKWLKSTYDNCTRNTQKEDTIKDLLQSKYERLDCLDDINKEKKKDKDKHDCSQKIVSTRKGEIADSKAMPPPPKPTNQTTSLLEGSNFKSKKATTLSKTSSSTLSSHSKKNQDKTSALYSATTSRGRVSPNTNSSFLPSPSLIPSPSLPNRTPNGLVSVDNKSEKSTKLTKKVILEPGHSPLDWARLSASSTNLSGLPVGVSYLKVPPSLLKKYTGRKGKDAWTKLGNKVYNITPYLPYHPGGQSELLRGAGRDSTKLFTEVHPWVNWEGMLAACLVGIAVEEHEAHAKSEMNELD